jgi:hypothetical protein
VTKQCPASILTIKVTIIGSEKNRKAKTMKAHKPAAMTGKRWLSIAAVLFLCLQIPLYAAVSRDKKSPPKVAHKKVTSKPALDILKKYQSIKTYHALWRAEQKQGQREMGIEYEAAFERKSGKTLFIMRSFLKKADQWVFVGGLLQVYDGSAQKIALSHELGKPMKKNEIPVSDPKKFTYRDFRKKLGYVYPFDLPLLYPDHALTEYPLKEIVQGDIKGMKVIMTESESLAKTFKLEIMAEGTGARMHVDSKTLLVKDFAYFRKGMPKNMIPEFKQVSCTINKPLKPELFDFKSQAKMLDVGKPKEKPANKSQKRTDRD